MAAQPKLRKLLLVRERLIREIRQSVASIKNLTRISNPVLISCKHKALDIHYAEFQSDVGSISEMSDKLEDKEEFFETNQSLEDEYILARVHIDEILPCEADPNSTQDRTFMSGNNHNSTNSSNSSSGVKSRSHLPDIKLTCFDGNYN